MEYGLDIYNLGSYSRPLYTPPPSSPTNYSSGIDPAAIGSYGGGVLGGNADGGGFMDSLMSFFGNKDGNMQGMGMNYLGAGIQGLGVIGALMQNRKAMKLAKDQFKFTKNTANTNLNNQIKSYNTALEDRANARAVMENRDQASAQAYIDKHKLSR
jgi:hypothetical protein